MHIQASAHESNSLERGIIRTETRQHSRGVSVRCRVCHEANDVAFLLNGTEQFYHGDHESDDGVTLFLMSRTQFRTNVRMHAPQAQATCWQGQPE